VRRLIASLLHPDPAKRPQRPEALGLEVRRVATSTVQETLRRRTSPPGSGISC
jgi:hypothetical protein